MAESEDEMLERLRRNLDDRERALLEEELRLREAHLDEIQESGQQMLAARWDTPFADDDALDLANIEVRTTQTGERTAEWVEAVGHTRPSTQIEETLTPLEQEADDAAHPKEPDDA